MDSSANCFRRRTRIATPRGEVAIETLSAGDEILVASGGARRIRWVGHREVDCAAHPDPRRVWPVRVRAHAFEENLPRRDLWLSPGHSIAVEGVLVPICALANGRTVAQVEQTHVDYWHVELNSHDIVLAEGLPAESFFGASRAAFSNGGALVEAHPDFRPRRPGATCLKVRTDGLEVQRTKARLLAEIARQGCETTDDPDLRILADGVRIDPLRIDANRVGFVLPPLRERVLLVSRVFTPAHMRPDSSDLRSLGVCLTRLQLDGETIALDAAALDAGWHTPEAGWRWTTGHTPLPADVRVVTLDLTGEGRYWREAGTGAVAALAG